MEQRRRRSRPRKYQSEVLSLRWRVVRGEVVLAASASEATALRVARVLDAEVRDCKRA